MMVLGGLITILFVIVILLGFLFSGDTTININTKKEE
jgi:hypothetical protein